MRLARPLLAVLLLVPPAAAPAADVTHSPEHRAAVNRQRRIFFQYDPAADIQLEGGFGSDMEALMGYVFDFADMPGSQLDAICIDVSNEGVAQIYGMVATLNAYRERLDDLPVIYEGDRAFMPTLQNDYWLKFHRERGTWRADAHSLIGFKAHVSRQEAASFYEQTARQLHEAAQKVGKKGVQPRALGTALGREITRLVRSRLFREPAPTPPAAPRKTD